MNDLIEVTIELSKEEVDMLNKYLVMKTAMYNIGFSSADWVDRILLRVLESVEEKESSNEN